MTKRFLYVLLGVLLGFVFARATPNETTALPTRTAEHMGRQPYALAIPGIADIVGDATTDKEALARIVDYYERERAVISAAFDVSNEQRLRALFGMYIVHTAAPYNVVETLPTSLIEFLNTPTAHCGTYSEAQGRIYTALGLTWRLWIVNEGMHGLLEVRVDDHWETFDSTANTWLSVGIEALVAGEDRRSRTFYTPILDPADMTYRVHVLDGWDVLGLRQNLVIWGQGFEIEDSYVQETSPDLYLN